MPQQLALLDEPRPTPQFRDVPTAELSFIPQEISAGFRESIERLGILQPIVVIQTRVAHRAGAAPGTANYNVVAGRRRAVAARALGLATVPAMVFPAGTSRARAAAIAISENNQRRPNVITDLLAIENMIANGYSERRIADDLSLPISTVRARLRLRNIPAQVREALDTGTVAVTVAEAIARLDPDTQGRVTRMLVETGTLTMAQVRDARSVAVDEQISVLEQVLPAAAVESVRATVDLQQTVVLHRTIVWDEGTVTLSAESTGWLEVTEVLLAVAAVLPTDDIDRADQVVALLDEAVRLTQRLTPTVVHPPVPPAAPRRRR